MIVGEAPGAREEITGEPFTGGAGELLTKTMAAAGIRESEVFFTNLMKYRPNSKNDLSLLFDKKSGLPDDDRLLEGLRELKEEIAAVDPTVIVALGNYPLWFLTGKSRWNRKWGYTGISDWRGSILQGKNITGNRKVVAAYHPAAILRRYSWLPTLQLDLQRAKEQSLFPEIRPPEKHLYIDPQGEERSWTRDRLLNHGDRITFDIEQIGSNLLCVGMTSDADEAHVIRVRKASDLRFIQDILESGKPLVAQNAMFDVSMLEYWFKMSIMDKIEHDTMLASHAAYIEQPKDLGYLCSIYTEQPCYWTNISWRAVKKELDSNKTQTVDSVDFLTYNAIDVWVTHSVMEQQRADELQDPNIRGTFDFEMSLLKPLWDIGRRGLKVDRAKMKQIELSAMTTIREKGARLSAIADRAINFKNETYGKFTVGSGSKPALLFSSSVQVAKYLFSELGLPVQRKTETCRPSSDDFTLADLDLLLPEDDDRKETVQIIRTIRKSQSRISKFTEIEFDADSRLRSLYNPGGTTTGRLASKKFAPTGTGAQAQNFPNDKDARSVFVPDNGHLFFYNDLERAESLVVAKITNDPLMLEHHQPGKDAHRLLACQLFGIDDPADITKDQRYMGKQTRHAGNYMEGPRTFMKNVNKNAAKTGVSITERQAKKFIGIYREIHPGLPTWWNNLNHEVCRTRKLYNIAPNKRMRGFYDRIAGGQYQSLPAAIAYIPQSTVGDAVNHALVAIYHDEECQDLGIQMMVQVHDAIGGQCPEKNIDQGMARLKELMTVPLFVPKTGETFCIPVEIAYGPSWGEVVAQ